ncbi:MAG TPA: signal peptidase I [Syntrophales bacterium]|nr:signal peptidase I [Syntrophales bacterium]
MALLKKRKPLAALALSLAGIGLGQLYNGRPAKAIAVNLCWTVFFLASGLNDLISTFAGAMAELLVTVAIYLHAAADALWDARYPLPCRLRPYQRWYVYAAVFAIQLSPDALPSMGIFTNPLSYRAYRIEGPSMLPTLAENERVVMRPFGPQDRLRRGEAVIFAFPGGHEEDFLKRVIGLPGDRIEIRSKAVVINGIPLNEPYVRFEDGFSLPAAVSPRDNLGPLTVPPGSYFVMGDNRDRSYDSRHFQCIDGSLLKGRPLYILWSKDRMRVGREVR